MLARTNMEVPYPLFPKKKYIINDFSKILLHPTILL